MEEVWKTPKKTAHGWAVCDVILGLFIPATLKFEIGFFINIFFKSSIPNLVEIWSSENRSSLALMH